jgi:hypothetical protein
LVIFSYTQILYLPLFLLLFKLSFSVSKNAQLKTTPVENGHGELKVVQVGFESGQAQTRTKWGNLISYAHLLPSP